VLEGRPVLICYDGSAEADHALRVAASLLPGARALIDTVAGREGRRRRRRAAGIRGRAARLQPSAGRMRRVATPFAPASVGPERGACPMTPVS
jgi:hypothetical protein